MRTGLVLRQALRGLRSRPAFTVLNAGVLAVGLAGTTTIAGLAGALLLRPLPYPDADRLVFVLGGDASGAGTGALTPRELTLVREQARSFEPVVAIAEDVAVAGADAEARVRRGLRVAGDLRATLGATVQLGRPLTAADTDSVLLGDRFWRNELGGRSEVVGQPLRLDGRPALVAGILGQDARLKPVLGFEPDWWRVLAPDASTPALVIARLRPGVSLAAAGAELALLEGRLVGEGGAPDRTLYASALRSGVDPVARVLLCLVLAAILGIVCLDVGSVLLAGALAREREIALRQALGATRGDVFAQLLLEGVLLGLLGGALALLLSVAAARGLTELAAGTNAEAFTLELDAWLLGVALAFSLTAGVVAGVAPALHGRGVPGAVLLNEAGQGATASRRAGRLRSALVAAQVALSLTLLTQAGLALSSLRAQLSVSRGFSAAGVLALPVAARDGASGELLLQRAGALPGITSVALAGALPASGALETYSLAPARGGSGRARTTAVTPGYFDALGLVLRAGRGFAASDDAAAPAVAIVNETLARREELGARALGASLEHAGTRRTIVGVVGDVRNPPLQLSPQPEIYVPWAQAPARPGWLVARTASRRPLALANGLAAAVEAEPGHRRGPVRELDRMLAADMGVIRLGTALLGAVALGAVLLTSAGTFGVVSFLAARRTREIGIRLSLGAQPPSVLRLVLLQGLRPVLAGCLLGLLLSLALGRVLASRVHRLAPADPVALLGAVLLFTGVLALACFVPARRAARVDTAVALRHE